MIGYITLGTNDLNKSAWFYDELLSLVGATRVMEKETFIVWGNNPGAPVLSITKPFDGEPATVGNGVMVSLMVDSKEKVDVVHAKAIALGGKNEGAPGLRDGNLYAGYFRDLEGNKLNAFFMT